MKIYRILLVVMVFAVSAKSANSCELFEYSVVNQSEIVGSPDPLQEYSSVITKFCLPLSGLITVECSKDIGEYSVPGEEILQIAKVFMRYRGALHELEVGRPYPREDCERIKNVLKKISERCRENKYFSKNLLQFPQAHKKASAVRRKEVSI